jgi:RNA polymerase sigma-70 factor (ECF subfamily)
MGDEELQRFVSGARKGDEEACRSLDEQLRPRLLRYFRAPSSAAEDAEDLVQKTLARVFRGIGGLENEESFLPWLFTIARNVRRTSEQRRRREPAPDPGSAPEEIADPSPPDTLEENEAGRARRKALVDAMGRLPARQRQCLALQIRDGLSYEEIAGTLRLSVNTVRNHLAAARESLRARLRDGVGTARRA